MWFGNRLTFLTFLFVCVNEVEDMSISVDLRVLWLDRAARQGEAVERG